MIKALIVKIIKPISMQYFPIRLPVGVYIIEPRTIKKAPNWIEKRISKKIVEIGPIKSLCKNHTLHNGILGNWKPNGNKTQTRQKQLFLMILNRFRSEATR